MRGYLALTAARFRVLLQYRAAAMAGIVTQLFWGLIRMMIFLAFYGSSSRAQVLELTGMDLTMLLPFCLPTRILHRMRTRPAVTEADLLDTQERSQRPFAMD